MRKATFDVLEARELSLERELRRQRSGWKTGACLMTFIGLKTLPTIAATCDSVLRNWRALKKGVVAVRLAPERRDEATVWCNFAVHDAATSFKCRPLKKWRLSKGTPSLHIRMLLVDGWDNHSTSNLMFSF